MAAILGHLSALFVSSNQSAYEALLPEEFTSEMTTAGAPAPSKIWRSFVRRANVA